MHVIIGLGNPGEKYTKTRHNVGWIVIDQLFKDESWHENKYAHALVATGEIGDNTFTIAKPQTFMNESGKTADYFINKENVKPEELIVMYDDLDLPIGKFKISFDRGSGGHNGIKSIEEHLGSREFIRIRIGISRTLENGEIVKPAVLGNFEPVEIELVRQTAEQIEKAIGTILTQSKEKAMTLFNQ